jgi:hypothetical protein
MTTTSDNSELLTAYANDQITIEGKTYYHVHDYSLIAYDIKDGAPAVNVLDPYPKLHTYHIIIERKCRSIEECEFTTRFTHIHISVHKMTYETFVKKLEKFIGELGRNGPRIKEGDRTLRAGEKDQGGH